MFVEWVPESAFENDPINKGKISRWLQYKRQKEKFEIPDRETEEYFPPEYCEVDRILDIRKVDNRLQYLVKWKNLPYDEATWELPETFKDDAKVSQFFRWNKSPPVRNNLPPTKFVKLEQSPTFKGGNTLRSYQLEGMNWLLFCWFEKRGCILADEMGLGTNFTF